MKISSSGTVVKNYYYTTYLYTCCHVLKAITSSIRGRRADTGSAITRGRLFGGKGGGANLVLSGSSTDGI
jgi:hypothetical protein